MNCEDVIVRVNGDREWRRDGKLHRENDLPAVEYADGNRSGGEHEAREAVQQTAAEEEAQPTTRFAFKLRSVKQPPRGGVRQHFAFELQMEGRDAITGQYTITRRPKQQRSLQLRQSDALRAAVRARRGKRYGPPRVILVLTPKQVCLYAETGVDGGVMVR